jgi:hypothetical protein
MLEVAEARALITTSLTDEDLAAVIAREEDWLARRIGPLEGERVETFVTADGDEVLRLTRPALEVVVQDDRGAVTDFRVRRWSDVVPGGDGSALSWQGDVLVTYIPDDEGDVKRALITLVRLTLNESAYAAEGAQGYSVTSDVQAQRTVRYATWRSLLRPRSPQTVRLRSAILGGRSLGPVAVTASGS